MFLLVIVIGLLSNQVSAQQSEVCQSILEVTSSSIEPDCQPLGDCTGLSCYSSTHDQTVKVIVEKCTDPLMVMITAFAGASEDNLLFAAEVTESGPIEGDEYIVDTLTRDDLFATISVIHNGMPAIPNTLIPLNASVCACKAAQLISSSVQPPPDTQFTCQVNPGCTGQECLYMELGGFTFYFETEFVPCFSPPGFEVIIRNSEQVALEQYYFDSSGEETILSTFSLSVIIEHFQYSMILSGTLLVNGELFQIIPHTQVMIDKSNCLDHIATVPTTASTTDKLPPTDDNTLSQQSVNPAACNALQQIKNETNLGELAMCTVTSNCNALNCSILYQYMVLLQPLLCGDTPGIHVLMFDNHNQILNEIMVEGTKHIPINMATATLIITVKQNEENISVKIDFDLGFESFPVIAEVNIPIDKCYCSDYEGPECMSKVGSSINVAAAVTVPIVVVIILSVVIIVAIVAIIMMIRRRKEGMKPNKNEDKRGIMENDELALNY